MTRSVGRAASLMRRSVVPSAILRIDSVRTLLSVVSQLCWDAEPHLGPACTGSAELLPIFQALPA